MTDRPFNRLLIANRGEIACRIAATCRRLGIDSVAIYSDADRDARHVRCADRAFHVGGAASSASYLSIERIIAAARRSGAEAVHPGYGFLAENAEFAAACAAAGLVFVGPQPETIRLMGSKIEAKQHMQRAGVPTVPGYHGETQQTEQLALEAERIGYPIMIKASAGGGGKGMRIVRDPGGFADALAGARREAKSAFGDERMLLERYLERPRHIEFQVFGDARGNVIHLFERECSIQRRYQKIIEEAPSPFLDEALRERMGAAAVAAARAVGYRNAGTVEFIVDTSRQFYFMEMNTRLQVEHPVTEQITGLDLVEWQLRIAAGAPLPLDQNDIERRGHAIEVRLYAENPRREFLPSTGRVGRFVHPSGEGVRIDTGIEDGDEVTAHYDPMIAKLIVHAADRAAAIGALRTALGRTAVLGPATNLPLLRGIAAHPAFAGGHIDTGYIDQHLAELMQAPQPSLSILLAGACRRLLDRQVRSEFDAGLDPADPTSPWHRRDGWQANGLGGCRLVFEDEGGRRHELRARGWDGRYRLVKAQARVELSVREQAGAELELDGAAGDTLQAFVVSADGQLLVTIGADSHELRNIDPYAHSSAAADEQTHPGSPLPGRIVALLVREGQQVEAGQPLLVVEGMKMEYTVQARIAGTVRKLHAAEGDSVEAEVPLIDIEPVEPRGGAR